MIMQFLGIGFWWGFFKDAIQTVIHIFEKYE